MGLRGPLRQGDPGQRTRRLGGRRRTGAGVSLLLSSYTWFGSASGVCTAFPVATFLEHLSLPQWKLTCDLLTLPGKRCRVDLHNAGALTAPGGKNKVGLLTGTSHCLHQSIFSTWQMAWFEGSRNEKHMFPKIWVF